MTKENLSPTQVGNSSAPAPKRDVRAGLRLLCYAFGVLFCAAAENSSGAAAAENRISFNREIQPILSEYCYHCHGPDSGTRKPKKEPLRLDRAKEAFEPRDGGKPVIVKGNPKDSDLLKRILSKDEEEVMPPPAEHKKVKPEEVALIEKWIQQGAVYESHWSFIAPTKPELPPEPTGWARNQIDHFVAVKLRELGLQPNPEEQKTRLLRRLSFDLTGLPPSERDIQEFLKDKSADSYQKAVDRMLTSDASAEHFTRHWLDAVRYADTQGIHHDHSRVIWPYRDWVISAFRTNMPFDRFTIEQISGDLLPSAGLGQKIASGYNRLLPTTGEGGAIPEEYDAIYAKDRVDTTSAVWLGLTAGCAACHDHKFDPISTRDFYSMTAFFRNNTMRSLDSGGSGDNAPMVFVPIPADRSRWPELEKAMTTKKAEIAERKKQATPDYEKWISSAPSQTVELVSRAKPALSLPLSETNSISRGVSRDQPVEWSGRQMKPGPFGPAPLLEGGEAVTGLAPDLTRNGRVSYGAFLFVEDKPSGTVFSRMNKAEAHRGWDLFLSDGRPTVHIVDQFPDAALKVTAKDALKPGVWHHVMVVFDGTIKGADAISLYVDGRKASVEVNNNSLGTNIVAAVPFRLGGRSDKEGGVGDLLQRGKVFLQDLRFYETALSAVDVARLASTGLIPEHFSKTEDKRQKDRNDLMLDLYLSGFDPESQKLQSELSALLSEERQIRERGASTLVMEEKKDSEPSAHILIRGSYSAKGEKVGPNTPEALPPMSPGSQSNRLGLARWVVSLSNPLTARVTVNRLWSQLFGIGIVETTEDFGLMGSRPVNQDLLDWLAVEFVESGWNYRSLVKTIVMSATYRQSAAASPQKLEKDPLNKFVSRGPRYRLDAEQIRDQALVAAGLLVPKVGGPSVRPYQPEGLWETVAMKDSNTRVYKQDTGDGLYRRSLYTFWKRTSPPPSMEILNAPSREVFCTRRERTDTPLQAFVTMNDPQFVEASRVLATRAIKSSKSVDARIDVISQALLARTLTTEERAVVRRMQEKALAAYRQNPESGKELIAVGETKAPEKLAPDELASWTLVASQILNLDEALTK